MKKNLFVIVVLITHASLAQNVEMLSKSDFKPDRKDKDFAFIEQTIDSSRLAFVASFKAVTDNKKNSISNLFFEIKKEAKKLGANSFRLRSFNRDNSSSLTFILDTYYANDSLLAINNESHFRNKVFVFCDERITENSYSLKVDNEKKEFKSGTYLEYELKEGQELKLSKGGFTGATMWIKYKENRQPVFLTITSFGLGGDGYVPPGGGVGLTFNTGRINSINNDLGQLLINFLTRAE